MANEATVRNMLSIKVGELNYRSNPQGFSANVAVARGPTPGLVLASLTGTSVDFSLLTQPGFCWMQNLSAVNYVEYGIWDPEGRKFFPLGEIGPGEQYTIKLSRNLHEEYVGPGTGTSAGGETNRLMLLAHGAACPVRVEAFEGAAT